MIEIGYDVDNVENQLKIFEILWVKLEELNRSIKRRVSYLIEDNTEFWNIRFDFDEYSDLDWMKIPEFLEIEATSWKVILQVAELLWFKEEELKDRDARELAEYYSEVNNNLWE